MKKLSFADWVSFVIIAACLVGCYFLTSCSGDSEEHISVLPTVQAAVEASDRLITCHDFDGVRPDKVFQVAKTTTPNERFCYVGDECFYNCR
jgi:putative component of membrane protein insertase Oxa1/YidC/SpoIIIJ protein YidD